MPVQALTQDQLKEAVKGFGPLWKTRVARMNSSGEMIINCDLVLPQEQVETIRNMYRMAGINLAVAHSDWNNPIMGMDLQQGTARLVYTHPPYITEFSTAKNDKPLKDDTKKNLLAEANRKMDTVIGHDLGTLPKLTAIEDLAVAQAAERTPG